MALFADFAMIRVTGQTRHIIFAGRFAALSCLPLRHDGRHISPAPQRTIIFA